MRPRFCGRCGCAAARPLRGSSPRSVGTARARTRDTPLTSTKTRCRRRPKSTGAARPRRACSSESGRMIEPPPNTGRERSVAPPNQPKGNSHGLAAASDPRLGCSQHRGRSFAQPLCSAAARRCSALVCRSLSGTWCAVVTVKPCSMTTVPACPIPTSCARTTPHAPSACVSAFPSPTGLP